MTQQHKSFMGQFAAAKKDAAELRTLMGDSARVATLSFPAPPVVRSAAQPKATSAKKKG